MFSEKILEIILKEVRATLFKGKKKLHLLQSSIINKPLEIQ